MIPVKAFGIHEEKALPIMAEALKRLEAAQDVETFQTGIKDACKALLDNGAAQAESDLAGMAKALYMLLKPDGFEGSPRAPWLDHAVKAAREEGAK